jgi:hypothetical protein
MSAHIAEIYRYPIKGLSAERLERVTLVRGRGVPHDRRFAIARGDIGFDPERPEWMRKNHFYVLMTEACLAGISTTFDDKTGIISIGSDDGDLVSGDLSTPTGRLAIETCLADILGDAATGHHPTLVEAEGHMFSDASPRANAATDQYVSLINLGSIRALEQASGNTIDALRFRANFHLDGIEPWAEMEWVGKEFTLGGTRLRVIDTITRCAATEVNPRTAERDLKMLIALKKAVGHIKMGVYAEVLDGGKILAGDSFTA